MTDNAAKSVILRVRVCERCDTDMVADFSMPGCEYRCPACGHFDEFFGKTREVRG